MLVRLFGRAGSGCTWTKNGHQAFGAFEATEDFMLQEMPLDRRAEENIRGDFQPCLEGRPA